MDEIIIKIKKLLALSKSSNEYEAQNAITKAQMLMVKHKLSMKEIDNCNDNQIVIKNNKTGIKVKQHWKMQLALTIGDNFACYVYVRGTHSKEICFYGKEEDTIICNIMLEYALKCIDSNGDKIVKEMKKDRRRKHFKGIKEDYALGFITGLKERFKQQIESNSEWGLVLQKDIEVINSYEKFSNGFRTTDLDCQFNRFKNVYKQGKKDGERFDISDKIEKEDETLQIG